ncbi:MAG: response regulator, partial [Pseudomonadota bacterium]
MDASNRFPVNILLVEDDEVDIENVRRIFERRKIGNPLFVARDGQEAQSLLQNGTVRSPALVLLDIGLPRMDGIEFLTWMRSEPEHKSHVVFIFTVSDKQTDLYRAY